MIELISVLVLGGASITAMVTGISQWRTKGVTSKRFSADPELEAPTPLPMWSLSGNYQLALTSGVPKEIQDEIDQTPEWWDRQAHQALLDAGARVIAREPQDIIQEYSRGGSIRVEYHPEDLIALDGCTCRECAAVLRHARG